MEQIQQVENKQNPVSYESLQADRQNFKVYLEKHGALDHLVKVLSKLYETKEKPENAIDFLKSGLMGEADTQEQNLKDSNNNDSDEEQRRMLKNELESLREKVTALRQENSALVEKLKTYEN